MVYAKCFGINKILNIYSCEYNKEAEIISASYYIHLLFVYLVTLLFIFDDYILLNFTKSIFLILMFSGVISTNSSSPMYSRQSSKDNSL